MARADFGTAKYQSKQLKASGLQKLRYYCQLCEKQCRDANGFKNHLSSPGHQRKVSGLSDSGSSLSVILDYSRRFTSDFLALLRINHGTKKINANKFYQEYILNDKNHVHMNSTRWNSLTAFIKHLGLNGQVKVEQSGNEDEFDLEIRLVDQGLQKTSTREKGLKSDDQIAMKIINSQIEQGKLQSEASPKPRPKVQPQTGPMKPIKMSLKPKKEKKPSVFDDSEDE